MLHFQFLVHKDIYKDLKINLPKLKGKVLDVGCGEKPYEPWFLSANTYIGIDIYQGSKVDVVVETSKDWPFETGYFDAVICTQVFEHTVDLDSVLSEIHRVLKPGGQLLVSVPFIYNEHGSPDDYRRFSTHGLNNLLSDKFEIIDLKPQGGIGSTLCTLLLNYIEVSCNRYKLTRILKGLMLPV
ncbi:bifunctional 2-polyprenyl-6-hydroxyphenol methylase/3-demethylubiquinol 3-O-methyltransferase UbiG [[Phormidium] sp. ETS-05]|uniref:class I SAM-dependent methyltransferase n=1 Tax=[Phormidium] sp. ETS-05 TaxID=222819 RepID=UPI0018EF3250|nr:class I SAM-dependent methyltransferase [[Phormidium] sp. ETS-05]